MFNFFMLKLFDSLTYVQSIIVYTIRIKTFSKGRCIDLNTLHRSIYKQDTKEKGK
jgi:hypothetical protein